MATKALPETTEAPSAAADGVTQGLTADEILQLTGFVIAGLETAVEEIDRTLELQQVMASDLSNHAMALFAAGLPQEAMGSVSGIIAALQADDRLRQRQSNLAIALGVLLSAAREMQAKAAQPSDGDGTATLLPDRWVSQALTQLTMEEVKARFAKRFSPTSFDLDD